MNALALVMEGGKMPLQLNYFGHKQRPYVDGDGDLIYSCPVCDQGTYIRSDDFRMVGDEIRTVKTLNCGARGCDFIFDISHSNFVPWEPTRSGEFMTHPRSGDHSILKGVWRSRNDRRRRKK